MGEKVWNQESCNEFKQQTLKFIKTEMIKI